MEDFSIRRLIYTQYVKEQKSKARITYADKKHHTLYRALT